LAALQAALEQADDDPRGPLDLDFVYGSRTPAEEFSPLDGQQRLTTLFLLHWYLALRDGEVSDFRSWATMPVRDNPDRQESAFSYDVRPSSKDFFDALVMADIDLDELLPTLADPNDGLSRTLCDRPWFYRSWLNDPTVRSCLAVLDAIHLRFGGSQGLYRRLVHPDRPAITFQFLDLREFGLTDDLYIKMNARGKPLTDFETFKASFQQHVHEARGDETLSLGGGELPAALYVATKFDTTWCDLFWEFRGDGTNADLQTMNAIRAVALAGWVTDSKKLNDSEVLATLERLRTGEITSYYDFADAGCLSAQFVRSLIELFDQWSSDEGKPGSGLGDTRYYDEEKAFRYILETAHRRPRGGPTYGEWVEFVGWCRYLLSDLHLDGLGEWMRVVVNLGRNTIFNRHTEFRGALQGMEKLLASGGSLLQHLAEDGEVAGFNRQQIREERLKAQLLLRDSKWRPLLEEAETHGYFVGQIEFLLSFSGVLEHWLASNRSCDWSDDDDAAFREAFQLALRRAQAMFRGGSSPGLTDMPEYLWERALLCEGHYLLAKGSNHGFLTDSDRDLGWKRLLRSDLNDTLPQNKRALLRRLFTNIDPDDVEASLRARIAAGVSDDPTDDVGLPGWRAHLVEFPDLIDYCGKRQIRIDHGHTVYLLTKRRRHGRHKCLFTSHVARRIRPLIEAGELKPFSSVDEYDWKTDSVEPDIRINAGNNFCQLEFIEGVYEFQLTESLVSDDGRKLWRVAPDEVVDEVRAVAERIRG